MLGKFRFWLLLYSREQQLFGLVCSGFHSLGDCFDWFDCFPCLWENLSELVIQNDQPTYSSGTSQSLESSVQKGSGMEINSLKHGTAQFLFPRRAPEPESLLLLGTPWTVQLL